MRASASTQVSLDYTSERDASDKRRLGTAIGPILAWFFRNTPYFEGAPNPWPLCRQRMWDYLDVQRTNVTPGLYDERFSWEDYAADVLSTPLTRGASAPRSARYSHGSSAIRRISKVRRTRGRCAASACGITSTCSAPT